MAELSIVFKERMGEVPSFLWLAGNKMAILKHANYCRRTVTLLAWRVASKQVRIVMTLTFSHLMTSSQVYWVTWSLLLCNSLCRGMLYYSTYLPSSWCSSYKTYRYFIVYCTFYDVKCDTYFKFAYSTLVQPYPKIWRFIKYCSY